jgi:hypothetical protein
VQISATPGLGHLGFHESLTMELSNDYHPPA